MNFFFPMNFGFLSNISTRDWGVLPILAYMGRLRPKGVQAFSALKYIKGLGFHKLRYIKG